MIKKFLIVLCVLILPSNIFAQDLHAPPLTIEEVDGSPTLTYPWKFIVDNGTLTDHGDGTITHSIDGFGAGTYLKLDCSNDPLTAQLDAGVYGFTTTGDVEAQNHYAGTSEADSYVYFYEDGSATGEYLKWSNVGYGSSGDRFEFSDAVYATALVSEGLFLGSGSSQSSYIYFWADGADANESIKWDGPNENRFEFSDDVFIQDGLVVGLELASRDHSINDVTPHLEWWDTSGTDAYMIHVDTDNSSTPPRYWALWRGTDTDGSSFAVNPNTPLMYFDDLNQLYFSNPSLSIPVTQDDFTAMTLDYALTGGNTSSSDIITPFKNYFEMNLNDEIGEIRMMDVRATFTQGTIADETYLLKFEFRQTGGATGNDLRGMFMNFELQDGDATGDYLAPIYIDVDQVAAHDADEVRGLWVKMDMDGAAGSGGGNTASDKMIYLDAVSNIDYGLHIDGTFVNSAIWIDDANDIILDGDNGKLRFGETQGDFDLFSDGDNGQLDSTGDIFVNPAGNVKFGTHAAIVAETVTGYVTIKDAAGNLRKIAVVS